MISSYTDTKRIKELKEIKRKFAILETDKGSIVLMKWIDYTKSLMDLFSDPTKFRKINNSPILTQLKTNQNYLCTLRKRNEITEEEFKI